MINILIVVHIILWYKLGYQKVGTFSLNGIVSLFGMGLLNSAAAFFILVVLITVFFGRLFCGWACHFAFFQEFALKILHKIRINPQIIHSKASIIQYVFLLKTLTVIFEYWLIYGYPRLHIGFSDTQVMTLDLPRNPVIIASFIVFDAFLFIYLMGSRAFCRYICPWAPMLAIFDNLSLWRIRKVSKCKGCMSCTKSCTMGIPVHEEIAQHGAVVNTNCIRCLACKDACPNGTLSYRWGLNVISITRRIKSLIPRQGNYGLYCEFLLIFCGLITAYYTQKWLGSFQTFLGAAWGLCLGILIIRYLGHKHVHVSETIHQKRRFLTVGLVTLSTLVWCWATSTPPDIRFLLRGNRALDLMEYDKAIAIYNQAINEFPSNHEIRAALALTYKQKGDYSRAITEYKILIGSNPDNAALHNNLGTVYYRSENYDLAIEEYKKAIQLDEQLTAAYGNLGLVFLKKGNIQEAIPFLRKVFPNEKDMLQCILMLYNPIQEQTG
ncbi:MAG: tetratricopeptide repeat protein [Candidatus Brocadia sp.]